MATLPLVKTILVPTLSLDGWVGSTAMKADYLISDFFLSEKSQTAFYGNEVASLPWIIQNYQGDVQKTTQAVRETLSTYFSRYFKDVTIDVSYAQDPPNSSEVKIKLYVSFLDDNGKEHTLTRLIDVLDAKIQKITNLNNNGPAV